jgi:hypothetical protein
MVAVLVELEHNKIITDLLKALITGTTFLPLILVTVLVDKISKSSTTDLSIHIFESFMRDLKMQKRLRGHWKGYAIRETEPGKGSRFPISFDIPLLGKIEGKLGDNGSEKESDYIFGMEKLSDEFVRIDFREKKNKLHDQGTAVFQIKQESSLLEGHYLANIDANVHHGYVELKLEYTPKLFNFFN